MVRERETSTTNIDEGPRASDRHARPGDAYRRVKELKTIAGGASPTFPPPTPEPSTTSRTGQGKPSYGTLENRRGHLSTVSWRFGDFRRMDDG